jgi:protein gp37
MAATSKIEWTTMTYNPWAGCSKVSPGCANCYAERMAKRLKAMGVPHYQDVVDENGWTGEVRPGPWPPKFPGEAAGPKMIFVGSMTDVFHEQVPLNVIENLFFHMLASGGHNTFQILTKRIDRAVEFFSHFKLNRNPKFWIGVSVCNQAEANEKIPELLKINAAVRFVSVEPMLGPVDVTWEYDYLDTVGDVQQAERIPDGIHQVICGGESGPGARPMHPDWARNLRDQCVAADVPFFFKQWGEWAAFSSVGDDPDSNGRTAMARIDGSVVVDWQPEPDNVGAIPLARIGKKKAGRELDGRLWDQYPAEGGALL